MSLKKKVTIAAAVTLAAMMSLSACGGSGSTTAAEKDDNSQISTLRGSIKTEIVNSSWKASFASSESECEKIFNEMIKTVNGLDIDSVLKVDMKNAKDQDKARKNILKEYQNKEKSSSSDSSSE